VLADYLAGAIPLNSFRTLVPCRDDPIRIEQENRVILYALNKQTKNLI